MDATPVPISAAEKLSQLRKNLVEADYVTLRAKISSLLLENEALKHELSKALKKSKKTAKKLKKAKKCFNRLLFLFQETRESVALLFHHDWEHTLAVLSGGHKDSLEEYTGKNGTLLCPSPDNLDDERKRNTSNWANLYVLDDWHDVHKEIDKLRKKIK